MIRLSKPVKLYEWGEGTNTTNQIWSEVGTGQIVSAKTRDGITTLTVELAAQLAKKNDRDNSIKMAQLGEGMTARSERWGEVAVGYLKSTAGKTVEIEVPFATKIDRRK